MKQIIKSWFCPIGTLSEGIGEFGKKAFGRNFIPWKWVDIPLRSLFGSERAILMGDYFRSPGLKWIAILPGVVHFRGDSPHKFFQEASR